MIKHLLLAFFFSGALCLLPSCTIFGGGSAEDNVGEGEDYYADSAGEGLEDPSDEGDTGTEEAGTAEEEGDSISDSSAEEDIHYIDEEEEDLIEEDAVVEEDGDTAYTDDTAYMDDTALPEEGQEGGGDASFFDSSASVPAGTQVTAPAQKWVSYKKIKSQPYNSAGFLINAVYIAREGDSMQSISQKIFGSDQTGQLYAINPHLKHRNMKTGDKVYYPSPQRPQDSGQLLFYFEDRGIPPNYHQVQAGDNIRSVASSLLGHKDSWKEVWATNPELESKGALNQARTIKYWPAGADSAPDSAQEPEEPEEVVSPASTDVGGDPAEPELEPQVEEGMPLEEEGSAPAPPEGGGDSDMTADAMPSADEGDQAEVSSQFSQTDMAIAGLLALSALILGFSIIRKRWKKKADFDYTAVNYEINE